MGRLINPKSVIARSLALGLLVMLAAWTGAAQNGAQTLSVSEAQARQAVKYKVDPEYPAIARQFHITGEVVAEFTIGEDGKVESVDSATGNTVLSQAVRTALRKWVFTPFQPNGKPVRVKTSMTFNFRL